MSRANELARLKLSKLSIAVSSTTRLPCASAAVSTAKDATSIEPAAKSLNVDAKTTSFVTVSVSEAAVNSIVSPVPKSTLNLVPDLIASLSVAVKDSVSPLLA